MTQNDIARKHLIKVLDKYGIKLKHIATELGWNYVNMVKFKNGNMEYSLEKLRELDNFLSKYNLD